MLVRAAEIHPQPDGDAEEQHDDPDQRAAFDQRDPRIIEVNAWTRQSFFRWCFRGGKQFAAGVTESSARSARARAVQAGNHDAFRFSSSRPAALIRLIADERQIVQASDQSCCKAGCSAGCSG